MTKHVLFHASLLPLRAPLLGLGVAISLAGCALSEQPLQTDPSLMQEALAGADAPPPLTGLSSPGMATSEPPSASVHTAPTRSIRQGNQHFVRPTRARTPAQDTEQGDIVFNFTDQPIEAVINSVMGDLLHENYSISEGVKGSVSFSTSKPVNKQQALSILETLLSWTDNAMIRQGERYVILPASQAVAGKLVPDTAVQQPPSGLSARLFPLRYIGANEMRKLLQPFVRENAFLLVDPARNVISLAGTPQELTNYQDTIDTFDVDWLKGMSIGVYGLQRASVAELMPQLQKLFGPDSGMPLADMVRFMPNERTNSIVAISAQPEYLQEVGDWIRTIDEGGGNEPQLYVYDVRNMKAADLARYLRQIYGSGKVADDTPAKVAPGLKTTSLTSLNGTGSQSLTTVGNQEQHSEAFDEPSSDDQTQGATDDTEGSAGQSLEATVRITAQKGSNQLLVRARPAQWKEIESAVKRLDTPPLQVQIETRILEVKLTGDLDLGVQWYLGRLAGNSTSDTVANESGSQGALGAGGVALGSSSLFYSFVSNNLQVALRALETRGLTQVLSAPSLVVLNNQQAQIQVGDNVPINQTTVNTSTSDTTLSSVEYVQTGVILDVVPRINPGGLVYMDIQQQVSDADDSAVTDTQPNPRISSRAVSTQVAVQSGQTVLLGGLIKQDNSSSQTRVPWLSSIPGLGWLFGSDSKGRDRTELIVLITPKVVNNPEQARQVTAEYRQQMQLLKAQEAGG
ncbi:type II secretion system protein GspD [Pseudomonas putida]|uniref:Type II secretion system protein GspD n=1 Tax=Pseudomonas putida TaxID=303 RepID=A0A4D6XDG9_PSEPU|nr:type II secretion system secretin GspD [Pseudomonas putida]QCI12381.1 type II secretion system protein GspD [Pseudomonas putida]